MKETVKRGKGRKEGKERMGPDLERQRRRGFTTRRQILAPAWVDAENSRRPLPDDHESGPHGKLQEIGRNANQRGHAAGRRRRPSNRFRRRGPSGPHNATRAQVFCTDFDSLQSELSGPTARDSRKMIVADNREKGRAVKALEQVLPAVFQRPRTSNRPIFKGEGRAGPRSRISFLRSKRSAACNAFSCHPRAGEARLELAKDLGPIVPVGRRERAAL